MSRFSFHSPRDREWEAIAGLVVDAIPNYVVSRMGPRFCTHYLKLLAAHPQTCSLAAYDEAGHFAGVVIGSLNSRRARRLTLPVIAKLLLAANVRLLSPAFLGWLARGTFEAKPSEITGPSPEAELIILVISPDFRGEGLAPLLLDALEEFFRRHHLGDPYLILTETRNLASNKFYEKIGARFIRTTMHHRRRMNVWHKHLSADPGFTAGQSFP